MQRIPVEAGEAYNRVDLVSTSWVYNRLDTVKIIDATRHIAEHRNAKSEYFAVGTIESA